MSTEIVINATPEETRVAILENDIPVEFYFDREKERGIIGNVYKGRVVKVLPGIQAAFVDIGTEKAAFLYVDDVMAPTSSSDEPEESDDDEDDVADSLLSDAIDATEEGGRRETAAVLGLAEEALEVSDSAPEDTEESEEEVSPRPKKRSKKRAPLTIDMLLKEGQEIIVQVSKEPIGVKGPRVTGYVSLPGRYLVFLPTVSQVGISRKITQESERRRLKEMIRKAKKPGTGYIVRTVSVGMTDEEIVQDMAFLEAVWTEILAKHGNRPAPALLHNDVDIIFQIVRDLFTREVRQLTLDSKREHDRIASYLERYPAGYAARLRLWDKETPIFEFYDLEKEIVRAKSRKVWLKSGGYLIIDRTEALTVIDVNTGRFVGKKDLEETIFKTNMEAAKEIARQLRLRNTGGIIVIDFIDMDKEKNRTKLFQAFSTALETDKAKTNILKISELGLVQMSRERTQEDLLRSLCEPCVYCDGRGYTKSATTVCYEIFREIRRLAVSGRYKKVLMGVHPEVAQLLAEGERTRLESLEREFDKKMIVRADANLHVEQYEIVPI
jgi:ribonuclease G